MRAHQLLSLSFAMDSKPSLVRIRRAIAEIAAGIERNREQLLAAQQQELSNSGIGADYQLQTLLDHARAVSERLAHWHNPNIAARSHAFVKRPAGLVSIFAEECQPLGQALVHCLYAIAAGNKVLLCLSDRCPLTSAALASSLQASDASDLRCVTYSNSALPDLMRLQSARLVLSGWRCLDAWREELRVSTEVQTEHVLQLAPTVNVVLCSPDAAWLAMAEQLLQAQTYQAGQWFACPNQVQIPRANIVEVVKCLAQSSQRQPVQNLYLNNPIWREELLKQLHDLSAKQVSIVETSLAGDFSPRVADLDALRTSADWPHLLVIDPPSEHPLSRTPLLAPITVLHGYKHISESLAYINSLNKLGVIYSFGAGANSSDVQSLLRAQAIIHGSVPITYQAGLIQHGLCTIECSDALYNLYCNTTIINNSPEVTSTP